MYKQEKGEKGEVRIENLEELVTATREFIKPDEAEDMTDLDRLFNSCFFRSGRRAGFTASILCGNDDLTLCKRLGVPARIYGGGRRGRIPKFPFILKSLVVWRKNAVLLMWALLERSKTDDLLC